MIKLNYNYSNICTKIEELENHFLDCKKPLDSEAYVLTYETLLEFLMNENEDYLPKVNLYKNRFLRFSSNEKNNLIQKKITEDLIINKENHSRLILDFIDEINEIISDYISTYYIDVEKNGFSHICSKEQEEILEDYFKSEGRELHDLFFEYRENNDIYKMPNYLRDLTKSLGATIYNPLDNKSIVFLDDNENKIGELSTIIHEFGHVLDFYTYSKTHSNSMTSLYFQMSPYTEINSTYQEYKFCEYLLNNNIYKNDTKSFLLDSAVSYLQNLSFLAPIGFIDSKLLRKHKGILSREEIFDSVRQETGVTLDVSTFDKSIDMKSALEYSYGMMIAFSMLDDQSLYDKVQMIRGPYFDKGKLDNIGLNDDRMSKIMVKKIENYFEK